MTVEAPPRVALFALGGTIASVVDAGGRNATMALSAEDLVAAIPAIEGVARLEASTFRSVMSANLGFDDILELAARIDAVAAEGADGVVVTQGTDTLEEVAFVLDRVVTSDIPVVVTGAMRNAGKPGADGPANLLAAVQVAASPLARGLGTLVVFTDEIHLARYVQKSHSSSPATFRSPQLGPIGWVTEGRVRIPIVPRLRSPRIPLQTGMTVPPVALVRLGLDDGGLLLSTLASLGFAGAVIEVYGGGHAPAALVEPLRELAATFPVVFASRTGSGELYSETGSFPGSERDLLAAGLVSAGVLDGLKSRILLGLLLARGSDRYEVARVFAETAL